MIYERVFEGHKVRFTWDTNRTAKAAPPALLISNTRLYSEAIENFWRLVTVRMSVDLVGGHRHIPGLIPRLRWRMIRYIEVQPILHFNFLPEVCHSREVREQLAALVRLEFLGCDAGTLAKVVKVGEIDEGDRAWLAAFGR